MVSPRSSIPPSVDVRFGRIAALMAAAYLSVGYATDRLPVLCAMMAVYCLGVALLMAAPRLRGDELLGAVAIWLTVAELLSAARYGEMHGWRWAVAVATLGIVLAPIKAQSMRNRWRRHARAMAATMPESSYSLAFRRGDAVGLTLPISTGASLDVRPNSPSR